MQITDNAREARHVDVSYFKKAITYVVPIDKSGNKELRGWNSPITARQICPRSMIEEFDADPKKYVLPIP